VPRALSVACLLGAFAAGSALAQQPGRATHPPPPTDFPPQRAAQPQRAAPPSGGTVMHFRKPSDAIVPVSGSGVVVPAAAGGQDDKKEKPVPPLPPEDVAKYTKLEGPERIFAMPDDEGLQRLIREKMLIENPATKPKDVRFPDYPDVGGGVAYVPKTASYPPMRATYDPLYVVHRRLHFEDRNTERQGWDLGIIQPAVSAVLFYKDVFFWPHSLASGCAHGFWDTSAGKCLPGSPTPYLLYPPGLTTSGSVFQTVMVTGMAFAIP
jgi:hypothetical protein